MLPSSPLLLTPSQLVKTLIPICHDYWFPLYTTLLFKSTTLPIQITDIETSTAIREKNSALCVQHSTPGKGFQKFKNPRCNGVKLPALPRGASVAKPSGTPPKPPVFALRATPRLPIAILSGRSLWRRPILPVLPHGASWRRRVIPFHRCHPQTRKIPLHGGGDSPDHCEVLIVFDDLRGDGELIVLPFVGAGSCLRCWGRCSSAIFRLATG